MIYSFSFKGNKDFSLKFISWKGISDFSIVLCNKLYLILKIVESSPIFSELLFAYNPPINIIL